MPFCAGGAKKRCVQLATELRNGRYMTCHHIRTAAGLLGILFGAALRACLAALLTFLPTSLLIYSAQDTYYPLSHQLSPQTLPQPLLEARYTVTVM